jgi:hypothetical protein
MKENSMQITIERIISVVLKVGLLLVALLAILFLRDGFDSKGHLDPALFSTFIDGFKAIAVGFLAGVLAITIPHVLPEKKFRFESFKESRKTYSQAETGVSYLADRLASLKHAEAVAFVQTVHEALHVAQTYKDELPSHLHEQTTLKDWGDKNYEILKATKQTLRRLVDTWDGLSNDARLQVAIAAVTSGKAAFESKKKAKALPSASRAYEN